MVPEQPQVDDPQLDFELELLDRTLTAEEIEDLTDSEQSPPDVTYSSQDFDVIGLVRRLQSGSMLIPRLGLIDSRIDTEGFQRGFVWSKAQMDRFVESLLLGYPVPGIFLIKQSENNRLLVLDGQQRLLTLKSFVEGAHRAKTFALSNVAPQFKGLTYNTLPEPLKFKFDDSYMQATIVATDGSAEVNNAIYQIFERLNSGGTQLTPHEIRVALAAGDLIAYLETLNGNPHWRALYGAKSPRLRDQELVLRIIALYLDSAGYSRPLKSFLNKFVAVHREPGAAILEVGKLFESAARILSDQVGAEAFRRPGVRQVNVAQAEAIMVGVMNAVKANSAPGVNARERVEALQRDPEFTQATTRATADNESVALRLAMSRKAFQSA